MIRASALPVYPMRAAYAAIIDTDIVTVRVERRGTVRGVTRAESMRS